LSEFEDNKNGEDEEDIEGVSESLKFRDFERVCPACRRPVTDEMDSCPYCGDILFNYLTDGTFAPRKGPLVKIVAAVIILLVILATLSLLLSLLT